jgi:hypothetical protein
MAGLDLNVSMEEEGDGWLDPNIPLEHGFDLNVQQEEANVPGESDEATASRASESGEVMASRALKSGEVTACGEEFGEAMASRASKSGEATACGEEFGEAMASRVSESDERRRSPTSGDKGKKDEGRARVQVDGRCAWMGSAARAMEEKMKSAAINRCN